MRSTFKFVISTAVAASLSLIGPSLSFGPVVFGSEAVKGTAVKTSSATSGTKLTKEETANGASLSPFAACKGFLMVEHSKTGNDFWKAREKSCDAKVSNCNLKVQHVPDSEMFSSFKGSKGVNMSSAITATAFLDQVRSRSLEMLNRKISERNTVISKCSGSTPHASCKAEFDQILGKIGKDLPEFRSTLGILAEPSNADLLRVVVSGDVTPLINEFFTKPTGFAAVRQPRLERMSSVEKEAAKKELSEILSRARTEWNAEIEDTIKKRGLKGAEADALKASLLKPENFQRKFRNVLRAHQIERVQTYDRIIGNVPEIAFIGTAKASPKEIVAGLEGVVKQSKTAAGELGKPLDAADLKSEEKINEMLQFAAYKPVIEAILEEEARAGKPSSCAVATAAYNRLLTVQNRTLTLIAGATLVPFAGAAAIGLGAFGAAWVGTGTAIAWTAGILGVGSEMAVLSHRKDKLAVAADANLADRKDVREAVGAIGLTAILAPLDVFGKAAAVTSGVLLTKQMGRFATAAIASGKLRSAAGANASEIVKLSETAVNAAGSTEATAAINKLAMIADREVKAILGRASDVSDEKVIKSMADSGLLGTLDSPNTAALSEYATATAGMSAKQRADYAERFAKLSSELAQDAKAGGPVDLERAKVVGNAALAIAAEPDLKVTTDILKRNSGWSAQAIENFKEVLKSATALARGVGRASKEAVSTRFKNALAKITGENPNSDGVTTKCRCTGICPVGASLDSVDAEPKFMACVNPSVRTSVDLSAVN